MQHVQIGTKVFLWDAIGEKAIANGYVDVKVMDVFIPFVAVTFIEIT
jgi:hypothetical protein